MGELFETYQQDNPPPKVVTKAALAEELGLAKSRITQLIAKGLPLTPNGRVPRAEALAWYHDNISPTRRKAMRDKPACDARSQLDDLRIERERLALERDKGQLVNRAAIEKAVFERARAERDAHLAWATRIAAPLAAELGADPTATFAALDRLMREHLSELSGTTLSELTRE